MAKQIKWCTTCNRVEETYASECTCGMSLQFAWPSVTHFTKFLQTQKPTYLNIITPSLQQLYNETVNTF